MTTYKHLLWFVAALLIVAGVVIVNTDAPTVLALKTETSQPDQEKNQPVTHINVLREAPQPRLIKQIAAQKTEAPRLINQEAQQIEAQKAEKPSSINQEAKEIEIRKEEERSLKKQDKLYTQQAQARADQYTQMAKLVASSGGDPKPLLDAAAYFENESK
jgi:hypothetical protein